MVQKLLKEEGVHFLTTYSIETKTSVVECFNRTLKTCMWRYFTEHQTRKYTPILQQLVHIYNHTYHRSIGRTAAQVDRTNEEEVWHKLYSPKQSMKRQA